MDRRAVEDDEGQADQRHTQRDECELGEDLEGLVVGQAGKVQEQCTFSQYGQPIPQSLSDVVAAVPMDVPEPRHGPGIRPDCSVHLVCLSVGEA